MGLWGSIKKAAKKVSRKVKKSARRAVSKVTTQVGKATKSFEKYGTALANRAVDKAVQAGASYLGLPPVQLPPSLDVGGSGTKSTKARPPTGALASYKVDARSSNPLLYQNAAAPVELPGIGSVDKQTLILIGAAVVAFVALRRR